MTTIPGPYESIPADAKQRIQANIPLNVHEKLFLNTLPRRGTQDRIMSIFIDWLYSQRHELNGTTSRENETKVIQLLSPLINKQPIQNHVTR